VTENSTLSRFKKLGQRFVRGGGPPSNVKAQPIPADVAAERRSGRRVLLPLDVRIKLGDDDPLDARLRNVNLTGLAVEPGDGVKLRDRVSVGFDGYPEICPAFALVAKVKRLLEPETPGAPTVMGLEIDREATSADAQKNYRRLVRHYLHHRPLLENLNNGYFEGRCTSCDWVGRVGKRKPRCSRCSAKVVPLEDE